MNTTDNGSPAPVRNASLKSGFARITLRGLPHQAGIAARFFREIGDQQIVVSDIIQSVSNHGSNVTMSFTVSQEQCEATRRASEQFAQRHPGTHVEVTDKLARLRVVGLGMRCHSGVAARLFEAVAAEGINIENISTSEVVISVLVPADQGQQALAAVQRAFGLDQEDELSGEQDEPDLNVDFEI